MYSTWMLRLLSMTLLVPRVDDADYSNDTDWDAIEIDVPTLDSTEGLTVILDTGRYRDRQLHEPHDSHLLQTGTSHSFFPPTVCNDIFTKWLKEPLLRSVSATDPSGKKYARFEAYVPDPEVYEKYDIVFKFLGSDGTTYDFRCGAKEFLVSPYRAADGYYVPLAAMSAEELAPYAWPRPNGILGAVSGIV